MARMAAWAGLEPGTGSVCCWVQRREREIDRDIERERERYRKIELGRIGNNKKSKKKRK